MPTIMFWPRHAGKSWLKKIILNSEFPNGVDRRSVFHDPKLAQDIEVSARNHLLKMLGTFNGAIFFHDTDAAPAPKQHRIQHGPVRKGRGGKPKRW